MSNTPDQILADAKSGIDGDEPTILIDKGGGWYWIDKVGGKKVQMSKAEIVKGGYVVQEMADAIGSLESPDDIDDAEVLRGILESQKEEIAQLTREVNATKATHDVSGWLFETVDDVKAFYPMAHLRDLAQAEIASINRVRMKEGYDRVQFTDEDFEAAIDEIVVGLLADRKAGAREEGPLMRTLKMVKLDDNGNVERLVQIPYEGQINNIAGSLEDGYRKYTKKNFKRTDPMLCPSQDCWEVSAEEDGKMLFTGYCSQDHYNRTEAGAGAPEVPGVTTTGAISGR